MKTFGSAPTKPFDASRPHSANTRAAGTPMVQRRCAVVVCVGLVLCLWASVAWGQRQADRFWTEKNGGSAMGFEPMVKAAQPAVINIEVTFRRAGAFSGETEEMGQGSGFIISPDGYALTNHHVVGKASEIVVVLSDDRRFMAHVIGSDESTDVALIKLQGASKLPILPLGDSDALSVGQWVVAFGSPLGLRSTVTAGIVSAKGRREVKPGGQERFYSNFIQTDASINPGNSGGPLLNLRGEVVGINTAINRLGQGIGFAIPVNMVKTLLPALKSRGFIERSWLGISIQPLDGALAKSFGLRSADGALVTFVDKKGPASAAGMAVGDVILEFDGQKVTSSDALPWMASVAGVGKEVKLVVWRDNKRVTLSMTLAPLPGVVRPAPRKPPTQPGPPGEDQGLEVRDHSGPGVMVAQIKPGSPALTSGLLPGDVIIEIGQEVEVTSAEQFYKELKKVKGVARVRVKRLKGYYFFAFPVAAP